LVVDGSLVSLIKFDGLTPQVKMSFDKSHFWIRMHHLPLGCMDKRFGLNSQDWSHNRGGYGG